MDEKVSNINEAIGVLLQAVEIGQKSGIYTFDDSALILQAINYIKSTAEKKTENESKILTFDEEKKNDTANDTKTSKTDS